MGFLDRAIKRGISDAVESAIGKAVAPKVEQLANQAAQQIDQATDSAAKQTAQSSPLTGGLEGVFSNLQRSRESSATEISTSVTLCPSCGQPTGADKKFCPSCGARLPEETVAQGAVCPACGKQNSVGTKFCADCGTKLPAAVQEEQASQAEDAAVMAQWEGLLPQYPKWSCGGREYVLEQNDGYVMFAARMGDAFAAENAVKQYRALLVQAGFRQAGQYPSADHLYKLADGVCYHVDMEHCFDGDSDCPSIYSNISEPPGGFNYVKPEPRKQVGFKDLLGL